jgi:ribosome-binding factor A
MSMINRRGVAGRVVASALIAVASLGSCTTALAQTHTMKIGMVTINAVQVTPDYAHATVHYSLLTGDPEETQAALTRSAGFLRNGLFKRLHIHTVPTLHFQFDRTTERAADMNALIAKAVASRSKDAEE